MKKLIAVLLFALVFTAPAAAELNFSDEEQEQACTQAAEAVDAKFNIEAYKAKLREVLAENRRKFCGKYGHDQREVVVGDRLVRECRICGAIYLPESAD